jgi:nucleoside-diphosphate-sugar epimerase
MAKKILISGGNSNLSSNLKRWLSGTSEVITLGEKDCDITCDLLSEEDAITLPNIDVVIHMAARFGGASDRDFIETMAVNVLGTVKVCQMAQAARASHVIIISSVYASLPVHSERYNVYSLSKRQAEEAAQLYCRHHALPLTILRPTQLYGDDDRFRRHQPFFYTIIDKVQQGEDIVFFGANDALRNYLHVDDLCQVIAGVVLNSLVGTFSCLQPKDVRFSEIASAAIEAFHSKSKVRFDHARDDIPDNVFPVDNTLYERLGFCPKVSLAEGMARIAAYRRRGGG